MKSLVPGAVSDIISAMSTEEANKTMLSALQRMSEWTKSLISGLLCLAALTFPFSVAVTNIALGVVLGVGLLSGIWWRGTKRLWREYRWLCIAAVLYWGLMLLGLAWSGDRVWGLHVLGRQWYWLLPPIIIVVLSSPRWHNRFLGMLSLGLTLHLVFCVLQMFGYVTGTTNLGSNIYDATGHIGHIGFGFVYGIWAGWLLHWGWQRTGLWRWGAWLLSLWAWMMIFAAQGRSGYLVGLAIISVILWRYLLRGHGWQRTGITICLFLVVIASMIAGPWEERAQETWDSFEAFQDGDMEHAGPRWSLWLAAIEVWKSYPVLGVGTGGFPKAAAEARQQRPELNYDKVPPSYYINHPDLVTDSVMKAAHPHNIYLFALARWSIWGLAALCMLLFVWIRTGWRLDWERLQAGPLITLSGVALVVHGLSSASLEDHFSAVLAALLLGLGLAELSAGDGKGAENLPVTVTGAST